MAGMKVSGRALHWVFKVGDRDATIKFYRNILGMKILRHEEFEEGCKATCNGPYDGKWSKTMVGYGPEDNHFVAELTYNYGIGSYKLGNDFKGITIKSKAAVANARKEAWPIKDESVEGEDVYSVEAPGGYRFFLVDDDVPSGADPVQAVRVGVSNLGNSMAYWKDLLGMSGDKKRSGLESLSFGEDQARLELEALPEGQPMDHATASGRIAFAVPAEELETAEAAIKAAGHNILTPLVSLDTPGKATVQVVILGDPDGHEICFVGAAAFKELSQVDPKGEALLDEAMVNDKSKEWFQKKGREKEECK